MQKIRNLAFLCVIDSYYRTVYIQRLMQDDTQGCLQAVQRGNTESARVTLPSSPLSLLPLHTHFADYAIHYPFIGMDSENALQLSDAPEESCITLKTCFWCKSENSARYSSSTTDTVREQQCQGLQNSVASDLSLVPRCC